MDARMSAFKRSTRSGWLVILVTATLTIIFVGVILSALHRQSLRRARAEADLRRAAALLECVVDSMPDGIVAVTSDQTLLHVNRAARVLLGPGFSAGSLSKDWRPRIDCIYEDGTAMKPEDGPLARAIAGENTDNLIYRTRLASNPELVRAWISATGRPVRDVDGRIVAAVISLRDISAQKRQEDQLRAMSMSDDMTGLRNRRGFLILAAQHARVAQRRAVPFAIVFADLNGLKMINDTLGHEAGDNSIRFVAGILRNTFRESDIIARLGGDEFVALLDRHNSGHERQHRGPSARRVGRTQYSRVVGVPSVPERRLLLLRSKAPLARCRPHRRG